MKMIELFFIEKNSFLLRTKIYRRNIAYLTLVMPNYTVGSVSGQVANFRKPEHS